MQRGERQPAFSFCFISRGACVNLDWVPRTHSSMKRTLRATAVLLVLLAVVTILPIGCGTSPSRPAQPKVSGLPQGEGKNQPWSFIQIGDLHSGLVLRPISWSNTVSAVLNNKAAWNLKLIVTPGD